MTVVKQSEIFEDAETIRVALENTDVSEAQNAEVAFEMLLRGIQVARSYLGFIETNERVDEKAMQAAQYRNAGVGQLELLKSQVLQLLSEVIPKTVDTPARFNSRPVTYNGDQVTISPNGPDGGRDFVYTTGRDGGRDFVSTTGPDDNENGLPSDVLNDRAELPIFETEGSFARSAASPLSRKATSFAFGPEGPIFSRAASISIVGFAQYLQSHGVNDVELLMRLATHGENIARHLSDAKSEDAIRALTDEIQNLKQTISELREENESLQVKLSVEPSEFWAKFNESFSSKLGEVAAETLGDVVKWGGLAAISGIAGAVGWAAMFAGPEAATTVQQCLGTYAQLAIERV